MTLWALFWRFFFIGLFTIGGGQVAITLMYQELVDSGIIDAELFYNMLAVSESTPGPIGINMATYLGTEMFGVWGGIITTLGTVTPSVIVILIIARFFSRMQDTLAVKSLFIHRAGRTFRFDFFINLDFYCEFLYHKDRIL